MPTRDKIKVVQPLAVFNAAMLSSRLYLAVTVFIAVVIDLVPEPKG